MRDKASTGTPAAGRRPLPPHDLGGLRARSGAQLTHRAGPSLLPSPSWANSKAVSYPAGAPDGFPDPRHAHRTASPSSSSFPGSPGSWDLIPPSRPVPGPTAARSPPSVPSFCSSPGEEPLGIRRPGLAVRIMCSLEPLARQLCTWGCSGRGKGARVCVRACVCACACVWLAQEETTGLHWPGRQPHLPESEPLGS